VCSVEGRCFALYFVSPIRPGYRGVLIKECEEPGTYNPGYSGGRDQEDHSLKPAKTNSSVRPYLNKTLHKK
jgi:hypothetical protein